MTSTTDLEERFGFDHYDKSLDRLHAVLTDVPVPTKTAQLSGDVVYCIQGDVGGPVKVGRTGLQRFWQRIKTLQTGYPFDLVVTRLVAENGALESIIHGALRPYRLRGEWFYPSREVAEITHCRVGPPYEVEHRYTLLKACETGVRDGANEAYEHALADVIYDFVLRSRDLHSDAADAAWKRLVRELVA
jgi:hypothetical protein